LKTGTGGDSLAGGNTGFWRPFWGSVPGPRDTDAGTFSEGALRSSALERHGVFSRLRSSEAWQNQLGPFSDGISARSHLTLQRCRNIWLAGLPSAGWLALDYRNL